MRKKIVIMLSFFLMLSAVIVYLIWLLAPPYEKMFSFGTCVFENNDKGNILFAFVPVDTVDAEYILKHSDNIKADLEHLDLLNDDKSLILIAYFFRAKDTVAVTADQLQESQRNNPNLFKDEDSLAFIPKGIIYNAVYENDGDLELVKHKSYQSSFVIPKRDCKTDSNKITDGV